MNQRPEPSPRADGARPRAPSVPAAPDAPGFVIALGTALHRYGAPAHRLEDAMISVSRRLGLEGQFFSTPTAIIASFGEPGSQTTSLVRVESSEVHLEKMMLLDRLSEKVVDGRRTPREALLEIERIVARPVRWRAPLTVFSHGLVSGAAARFLGGGLAEIAAAALIGLVTGVLFLAMTRHPAGSRLFELVAALLAAFAAAAAGRFVTPVAPYIATLAGLIVLMPGLTLTTAMNELATRNLVSGSARLTAAAMVFLQIAFGVALGGRLFEASFGPPTLHAPTPLPLWTEIVALVAACAGLVVLFRAPARVAPWILLAAAMGFWGARGGATFLGTEIGICAGAFLVGIVGNSYARIARRPSAVLIVPGVLLLVPGSLGFKSLSLLLQHDPVSAISAAFSMVLAAVSIVAGLLVANVTVSPRRPL